MAAEEPLKRLEAEVNRLAASAERIAASSLAVAKAQAASGGVDARALQWAALAFAAGVGVGLRLGRVRPFWRRFATAADVPADAIGAAAKPLLGRVVSVSDGDTLRLLHTPTWLHSSRLGAGAKLSESTLQVRLCTVDAPEVAKFGKPGQPFGEAAKAFVERRVLGRIVRARVLSKDQYGRVVAQVERLAPWWWPFRAAHLDEQLLRAGLAEVYRGGGAVYGPLGKARYLELEAGAKSARVGQWAQGGKVESAAEFKARSKAGAD
jgi:endonuclease YncB( thermonuclease family)